MIPPATTAAPARSVRSNGSDHFVWRAALSLTGVLLWLIGAVTLAAWATDNVELVQIDSSLAPFHYNAAFAMIPWGGAFLALARGRDRLARALAGGMLAIASLLFIAQFSDSRLGLDHWLFSPTSASARRPHVGAPPALIFGLVCASIGIILSARREPGSTRTLSVAFIGSVLVVGSATALLAVQGGAAVFQPSGITLLGVVSSTIAGLALLTALIRRGVPSFAIGHSLPLTVGAAGVAVTFAMWVALNAEQNGRLHRQVQFEAEHVNRVAEERLTVEAATIAELSERWVRTEPEKIKEDVAFHVGSRPGCLGVARISSPRSVQWLEYRQSNPPSSNPVDLGIAEAVEQGLRQGNATAVRPPRSCWNGTRVLVLFAPDRRPAGESGGLIAVYRVQEFFDTALNANVALGYAIAITDDREQIFGQSAKDDEHLHSWVQVLPMNWRSFHWRLAVWPTPAALQRESLSLPRLALIIGLITTSLLALAVHLARMARRRTADLENEVREREHTQLALKQSEEKYRSLIENLGQGIFLLDRDYRYVAANATFCRSLGRDESAVVGFTDADLFDGNRAGKRQEEAQAVLSEGKTMETEEDCAVNGRKICIRRVLTPVRDAAGRTTGVLGICWDVTEQRQLEAHVHQASKMDAIGQLAGGIAHDFNNLLTAIIGNLDLVLDDYATSDSTRELAGAAHGAATRAASLTQRLLGFSRRHKFDWVPVNINTIVEEVVDLLRRTIDPHVRIQTRLTPGEWPVQADPAQINQVLMNLCLNARDAMPAGGTITIETSCLSASELPSSIIANRTGDFLRLRVSDTGEGMTEEVKARIYEPFFTTKDVGKGTGLGLPMVFAIVRRHKGWIHCSSQVGRGTCFDILFPRGEAVSSEDSGPVTPIARRAGKETVLVVDDEEMIRRVATLTLKAQGYTVLEAEDGQQAVDLYEREGEQIDLVLLDLTMPILSGQEAFRHLIRLNSRVKVVFASGYAEEQLGELEQERMVGFLKKPYRPSELLAAVDEALQRQGHGRGSGTIETRVELAAYV